MGEKRLKITELARIAGLNKNTVLNLYHNRSARIEFEVLDKLCTALDCNVGDLFEHAEEEIGEGK